jgi:hypothetical protein
VVVEVVAFVVVVVVALVVVAGLVVVVVGLVVVDGLVVVVLEVSVADVKHSNVAPEISISITRSTMSGIIGTRRAG